MAIIPALPGISATIRVDNEPLPEYPDDEAETASQEPDAVAVAQRPRHMISKYIESAEGQEFSINFSISPQYQMDCPALEFTMEVDGNRIRGKIAEKVDFDRKKRWSSYRAGVDKGVPGEQGVLRAFRFAAIKTSLDDDALTTVQYDMARIKKVGEIVVEVWLNGQPLWRPKRRHDEAFEDYEMGIHEKALKGQPKYLGVSLGQGRDKRLSSESAISERLSSSPLARFVFKYRSREALRQLLIIPRTPEPDVPKNQRRHIPIHVDLGGLDDEQMDKVLTIMKSFKGIKRPADGLSHRAKIKPEPGYENENENGGPSKRRKISSHEVIDLTSDKED